MLQAYTYSGVFSVLNWRDALDCCFEGPLEVPFGYDAIAFYMWEMQGLWNEEKKNNPKMTFAQLKQKLGDRYGKILAKRAKNTMCPHGKWLYSMVLLLPNVQFFSNQSELQHLHIGIYESHSHPKCTLGQSCKVLILLVETHYLCKKTVQFIYSVRVTSWL